MPLRMFGGVSRAELYKSLYFPVNYSDIAGAASFRTKLGSYAVTLIDAANDEAWITGFLPTSFTSLYSIHIIGIGQANVAAMHIDCDFYHGGLTDAYNARGAAAEVAPFATVANAHIAIPFFNIAAFELDHLKGNCEFGCRLYYRAADAHTATNLYVTGITLRWA